MRSLWIVVAMGACGRGKSLDNLDLDQIHVGEAKLRTDTVGGGAVPDSLQIPASCTDASQPDRRPRDARLRELCDHLTEVLDDRRFSSNATFVLVDADNASDTDAYVTLAGTLRDAQGAALGDLKPESLWIPAGEQRTFALVDAEHTQRPGAAGAQIRVRGARADTPPVMHLEAIKTFDDYGKTVVQATLVNDADHPGRALVFAAFRGADQRPMARPFSFVLVDGHAKSYIQLVGPQGSKTATVFVGETIY